MTQPPGEPQPLDYHKPDAPHARRTVLSAIVTASVTVIGIVPILGVALEGGIGSAIAAGTAMLALVGYLSWRWYQIPAKRGRAVGLWVGVGLAVLLEGLCFASLQHV
jgi:hypothetical protein